MSYDGLFQLGMGAVLLRASQTEDTITSGATTRRIRALYQVAQSGTPARGSRMRFTSMSDRRPILSAHTPAGRLRGLGRDPGDGAARLNAGRTIWRTA